MEDVSIRETNRLNSRIEYEMRIGGICIGTTVEKETNRNGWETDVDRKLVKVGP